MHKFNKKKTEKGYYTVDPYPTAEELKNFYANEYYYIHPSYKDEYTPLEIEQKKIRAELTIYSIENLRKDKGSVLEIGCGEGFIIEEARNKGFAVRGIDFSDIGIKRYHPHLIASVDVGDAYVFLEDYFKNNIKYDICIIQNVLEHVLEPALLIASIKKILNNNGLLVLTAPNDFSRLQEKLMELKYIDREYWFAPPQHLSYFNVDSIKPFITDLGFEIKDAYADFPIEWFLFHKGSNYVINPAENGKPAHNARLQLDIMLAENGMEACLNFHRALTQCNMGRNVTIVCEKIY
jgi:2-polyprenyl-3-methyl-5-hydroxy-6-metoxy-1,4-benzoquinol methylase